jgi:hypothetical protein
MSAYRGFIDLLLADNNNIIREERTKDQCHQTSIDLALLVNERYLKQKGATDKRR